MKKCQAFSLVEFVFFLILSSILVFMSVSSWQNNRLKHEVRSRSDQIEYLIDYARNRALIDKRELVLMPIQDKDWSSGVKLMSGQKLLQVWRWDNSKLTVSWHGFQSKDALNFSPDISKSTLNGRFTIKAGSRRLLQQDIVVNRLGRTSIKSESVV